MSFFNTIKETVLWVWQLPQNLLGLFLLLIYRKEKVYYKLNGRTFYFTTEMPSGISLGNYIIMNRKDTENGMKHEYGHSIDSRKFGPLYLLIIGIPSALGNLYDRIFHRKWKYSKSCRWYYNQWWEKRADKNGRVDRESSLKKLEEMGY